ncbi:hypothetical protein OG453_44445 [Streptomyces sp. NBC_01381]|uniref:hypothetical protein n=1 Tax=Streptomyces sp. NBC_01381 TaxID=2903845 RepID=UPI002253ABD7|nr:hypothetical protein [Streptomyces sp. NBC_01381]MCX4673609.1 hypothetical protein [Streptomyces sp. NBC_01381]
MSQHEYENPEDAEQLVQKVSRWYSVQIIEERRAAAPDPERLKVLRDGLAQCAADQQALGAAEPDEVAEIAARYAARAKELGGQ